MPLTTTIVFPHFLNNQTHPKAETTKKWTENIAQTVKPINTAYYKSIKKKKWKEKKFSNKEDLLVKNTKTQVESKIWLFVEETFLFLENLTKCLKIPIQ